MPALAAVAALLPVLGAVPSAGAVPVATGTGFRVEPLRFTVAAGGRRCVVDADLYRPEGVDRERPAPAVLATNGFGGSKSDGSTHALGEAFARRGYVTLAYSGLGFGGSGGCPISMDDPAIDGAAASQLVDFLGGGRTADDGTRADFVAADRPGDPRVGMIGGSYGGAVQLATASVDRRVDALVPMITWHDLAYSLVPNGVASTPGALGDRTVPGPVKWPWTNGFYLAGERRPVPAGLAPSRVGHVPCRHFVPRACAMVRALDADRHPAAGTEKTLAYLRGVSPVSYLGRVKAPTLLVQGQADTLFHLNEATATYRTLAARGTPVKMIWQSWGHSGGPTAPAEAVAAGELNIAAGNWETSYVGRRVLAWFERHLRARPDADTGPAFAYHRDWITDPADAYATADRLPAPTRSLYLSGDGRLAGSRAGAVRGSRSYANAPVPTSHSESLAAKGLGLPDPPPHDLPGTHLAWTSAPLEEDLDVVGAPTARFAVSSPDTERTQGSGDHADRLVLFAKLYDVAPDGSRTLAHRLIAPVRVPDVREALTVTLPGIVHRFARGHRLRFVIAASDDAYGRNRGVKRVTVTAAPGADASGGVPGGVGVLRLPVAGDAPR